MITDSVHMEGTNVTHYSQTVFAEIMWMNSSDG